MPNRDALLESAITSLQERATQPESASPDPQAAASLAMATFDGLIIQWLLASEQIASGRVIADTLKRTAALAALSSESIDAA